MHGFKNWSEYWWFVWAFHLSIQQNDQVVSGDIGAASGNNLLSQSIDDYNEIINDHSLCNPDGEETSNPPPPPPAGSLDNLIVTPIVCYNCGVPTFTVSDGAGSHWWRATFATVASESICYSLKTDTLLLWIWV